MAALAPAVSPSHRLRDLVVAGMLLFLLMDRGLPALRAMAQDGGGREPRIALANAFTYQGRLVQDGIPGDGPYDFQFAVYDNPSVGVGTALGTGVFAVNDLQVTNGLFTAQLDFGSSVFTGDKRWLEVRVRPGNLTGAYTTLGRNELTATPYALFATSAPWSGISGIPDDIEDGDADTTYSASAPLSLQGTTFELSSTSCTPGDTWVFNGTGWDCDAAAGAHNHFSQAWTGSAPNGLSITNTTGNGFLGTASATGMAGVKGVSSGTACTGSGGNPSKCIGVYGEATADTDRGVGVLGVGSELGVSGQATAGIGVDGLSTTGYGVHGRTTNGGFGVYGEASGDGHGVVGQVNSAVSNAGWYKNDSGTAVYGRTSSNLPAIVCQNFSVGQTSDGVSGISANGVGVRGNGVFGIAGAGSDTGVRGVSDSQKGVEGFGGFIGVSGLSSTGTGVNGSSQTGPGVVGRSSAQVGSGTPRAGVVGLNSGADCADTGSIFPLYCAGVLGDATGAGAGSLGVAGIGNYVGVWGTASDAGGYAGYFIGDVRVTGTVNPGPSDARLKSDITDLDAGLVTVLGLKPVTFSWNDPAPWDEQGRPHAGLIAQDVREVFPSAVYEDEDGMLRLDYDELIPVLIRAIQEQQAEIDALKAAGGAPAASPASTDPVGSSDGLALALGLPMLALAGIVLRRST